MSIGEMNNFLETGKKLLAIVVGLAFVATIILKYDDLKTSVAQLGGRIKSAEVAGVKLEFSEATIDKDVRPDLFRHLDAKMKRAIVGDIAAFEPREVVRLLSVGLLEKTCDFETPTRDMALAHAADIFLRENRLAELVPDDATRDAVRKEIAEREKRERKKSAIGYPRSCYKIKLTDRGIDVRTAMVHVFAANFAPGGSGGAQLAPGVFREARE